MELPIKSFQLPDVEAMIPNKPYCECEHCGRVIMEVNFYHCPVSNCLVQPRFEPKTIMERLVTRNDLTKINQQK